MAKPSPSKTEDQAPDGRTVAWTTGAVLLVMCIGIPWAAPVAAAVPLMLKVGWKREPAGFDLVWRWALAVMLVGVASMGLAGDHAVRSIPFGSTGENAARAWLAHGGPATPGIVMIMVAAAVFAAASAVSRGILGCLVLAGATLRAAIFATVVYRAGTNIVAATAAAFPLWTLAWLGGMVVLFAPLAAGPGSLRTPSPATRRALITGAALLVLAVVLRLATAPLYTSLARHITMR